MPQTINSANYVYFVALEEIGKLNNPTALKIYCGITLN
jgi:geranylgeranyl diphosphate synthase type 3